MREHIDLCVTTFYGIAVPFILNTKAHHDLFNVLIAATDYSSLTLILYSSHLVLSRVGARDSEYLTPRIDRIKYLILKK